MNKWIKTLLCGVATAALVACGGGDDAPAAAAGGGAGGSASTQAALTGMSDQVSAAASFAVEGMLDGYFGALPILSAPTGMVSPAAQPNLATPSCSSGSVTSTASTITYSNCKLSDATLNGTVGVVLGVSAHTVTFSPVGQTDFTVALTTDSGKSVTYKYTGTQVITRLEGTDPVTGFTVKINSTVFVVGGSTSFKLTNFLVNYDRTTEGATSYENIDLAGKYLASVKLADFGVTVPGFDTLDIDFDITTPTRIKSKLPDGPAVAGVYKLSSASFSLEVDFGANKVRLLITGAPAQEFPLQ
jgi:hypothetical protein